MTALDARLEALLADLREGCLDATQMDDAGDRDNGRVNAEYAFHQIKERLLDIERERRRAEPESDDWDSDEPEWPVHPRHRDDGDHRLDLRREE